MEQIDMTFTPETQPIKQTIGNALRENVCLVRFIKVDGSERTMKCTLREDMIPEVHKPKHGKAQNDEVLAVFDLDKEAWRSFRLDSVLSCQSLEG